MKPYFNTFWMRWLVLALLSMMMIGACKDEKSDKNSTGQSVAISKESVGELPEKQTSFQRLVTRWRTGQKLNTVEGLLDRFREHVVAVEMDDPLGHTILNSTAAANHLLQEGEPLQLTGIEAGLLLNDLLEAAGQSVHPVLYRETRGATSLRHRTVAVRIDNKSVIHPFSNEQTFSSEMLLVNEKQREALLSGLKAIRSVEKYAFKKAQAHITESMAAAPQDNVYRFLRGQILLMQGDFDAGILDMEAAVKRQEDAHGQYQLGMAALQLEQSFKAYRAFRRAVELSPKYGNAWYALGVLSLKRLQTADVATLSAVGQELDSVEKALSEIDAHHVRLYELRARRALVGGQVEQSRQVITDGMKHHSASSVLHGFLAELAIASGDIEKAVIHLEKATQTDKSQADYWLWLASAYGELGKVNKAIGALEDAVEAAPFNPEIRAELVRAYQSTDQIERAQKAGNQLKADFPDRIDGPLVLIELAILRSEYKTVISLAIDAAKKHPDNLDLQQALFLSHAHLGQQELAETAANKMAKIDPNSRVQLAEMLLEMGTIEPALLLLEQEVYARPKDSQSAMNLALLYRRLERSSDEKRIREWMLKQSDDSKTVEALYDQISKELDSLESGAGLEQ